MEIKKLFNSLFYLALGFTVYYGFSAYNGSKKMIDYDIAKRENKKDLDKLDSLEVTLAKMPYDVNIQKILAKQKLSAQRERATIRMNTDIGTGVYRRRLIKFYCGLGVLILSSTGILYVRRKKGEQLWQCKK